MIRVNSREVRSAASQYLWLDKNALAQADSAHPAFSKYWAQAESGAFTKREAATV